jgi:hypothetical protein
MLRTIFSRGLAAGAGVALLTGVLALPASAAQPVQHACVGETVSALASPAFGPIIASFATADDGVPGIGDGLQQLQAGEFPDSFVPNTCNDG